MVVYQNDPLQDGYCPDPSAIGAEAMQTILTSIKDFVCSEQSAAKGYIDSENQKLLDRIAAIEVVDGLAEKLAQIEALLKEIDLENDGFLELINGVKIVADQALQVAQSNTTQITNLNVVLTTLGQDLASYKIEVNERFLALTNRVDTLETTVTNIDARVTTVEAAVAEVTTGIDDKISPQENTFYS